MFSDLEYTDMLLVYGACGKVGRRAAAEYRELYPNRRHPDAATFTRLHQRLLVRNPDGGPARRARAELDEAILECFAEDPTTSLRATARRVGTSYSGYSYLALL